MKIVFRGDRNSKTIKVAWFLRKVFGKKFIKIIGWDGYPSHINLEK